MTAKAPVTIGAPARFVLVVLALVAVAAIALAPRRSEQVAMLRDQKQEARIVAMLEPQLATDDDPELLITLGQAHAALGDYPRADELIRRYIARVPGDARAYGLLADIVKAEGDAPERADLLAASVRLAPEPARVAELASVYQGQGRPDAELDLLRRHEAMLAPGGLRLRLATVLADSGNAEEAVAVLRRVEASTEPARHATPEERLLLAALLAKSGRGVEAATLAAGWIGQWRQPFLAMQVMAALATNGADADAAPAEDAAMALHPEIRFYAARKLGEAGAKVSEARLLETWPRDNPAPTMDAIAGFLTACRDAGRPNIVWGAFGHALRGGADDRTAARYASAIAAEFGIGALAPFWREMPRSMLDANPLLEARLAFHEGDRDAAMALARQIDPSPLDTADQATWAAILTASGPAEQAFATMDRLHAAGLLPAALTVQYVALAAGLGEERALAVGLAELEKARR